MLPFAEQETKAPDLIVRVRCLITGMMYGTRACQLAVRAGCPTHRRRMRVSYTSKLMGARMPPIQALVTSAPTKLDAVPHRHGYRHRQCHDAGTARASDKPALASAAEARRSRRRRGLRRETEAGMPLQTLKEDYFSAPSVDALL